MKKPTGERTGNRDRLPPDWEKEAAEGAFRLRNSAAAMVLAKCSESLATMTDAAAVQLYRNNLLADAGVGGRGDPLEIMLIEQFVMANQKIGDLHVRASQVSDPAAINVYVSAVAKLMGECRRSLLALKAYRTPTAPAQVTIVGQQNLSAGDQQVAYVDQPAVMEKNMVDIEQGSKTREALPYEPLPDFVTESQASCGREAEPIEAQRAHPRRRRGPAASRAAEPPVDALNGTEIGGW